MRRMCRKIGGIGLLAALAVALLACPVEAQDERVVDLTPESEEGEGTEAALTAEDILEGIEKEKRVERERDAFLSDTYTKSALALYDELEFEAARNEFTKALERGPNNIAAKEGLRKTETIIGLRDAKYNRILNQFVEEKQVELELAYHESKVAFAKAHELVKNREYAVALERLERVRELVKWISPYFDKDEMEPLRLRTEELITAAKDGEQARLEEERLERRRKADAVARMRASKAQERDELRIAILLKQGGDLLAEARYSEAQTLGESVLDLDPFNKEALALRDIAFEAGLAYNTAQTEKTLDEETRLT
ncbi:MAG: hypothetical protein HQ592_16805, partial [Planctomycetes bacterium]|nr:hypothetical protein [Planctomycetota bacterium]